MKKIFTFLLSLTLLGLGHVMAQGLEDFTNFPETSSSYVSGTFVGNDGSTWTYTNCSGNTQVPITVPSPVLGKGKTPAAAVESGELQGGIGTLSFDYMQPYTTNVSLDVFVNDILVATVTSEAQQNLVLNSGTIAVNTSGACIIKLVQSSATAGQVTIDNITWTANGGGLLPEPSEYPASFVAVAGIGQAALTWVDAAGVQAPQKYLILVSTQNNIQAPVDGTAVADDLDLSDGKGAKNVTQGLQGYTFTGLSNNQVYYFAIYPYTNGGSDVNFKTDGTAPAASITTPNIEVIHSQSFDGGSLAPWTQYSVLGTQVWTYSDIYGVNDGPCAKMTGYEVTPFENEDWLISPALDLSNYTLESFIFQSAKNYTGNALEVFVSDDYAGTGDPNLATWSALSATLSAGSWAWTSSGYIDISTYGENIYLAFKFTSSATESATWEVDEIQVLGKMGTGISEASVLTSKVYPSPTTSNVHVVYNGGGQADVRVYDLTGSVVLRSVITAGDNVVSVRGLNGGMYLMQIEGDSQVYTHKLIIR
ncbi:MAG TPA: hypothetical protein DCR43_06755 [Bacteroidales bacterium]|nr:MAG: hypothetical protein A2X11_16230 [Bacteroidetes bacterium GWE2_42_24]OFY29183.1 MAG: hypothetical protein A2X09_05605 [Bacteroidetes bacterium GWF2_43_11]HAQ65535.1 hypothetical protein [Bacteroidales bacterium]HBZ66837.1 hypothetical protein [Bacteroidales bacterium]